MIEIAVASINTLPYPAVPQTESTILNQILAELRELREENASLRERIEELEELTALERAFDRKRISALEHSEPQPMQRDRGEILRALIAAYGGKMLEKEARQKMNLSKELFSMLISSMDEYIEIKPLHSDKRKNVLILK